MTERRVPDTLVWLGLLIGLAVALGAAGGIVLYLQDRTAKRQQAEAMTAGHVDAGRTATTRYGCGSCHVISGVAGANGKVGPDLTAVSERATIAGRLANQPDAMVSLLRHPQAAVPGGGMPEMGVTEADARDMAAFLYARN